MKKSKKKKKKNRLFIYLNEEYLIKLTLSLNRYLFDYNI